MAHHWRGLSPPSPPGAANVSGIKIGSLPDQEGEFNYLNIQSHTPTLNKMRRLLLSANKIKK